MIPTIAKAVVLGAGTMGSGIAAHLANAGVRVRLLDVVPSDAGPAAGAAARHRSSIARAAVDRLRSAQPPAFYTPAVAARVTPGNLEDDFDDVASADWIVEAIVEQLDAKRALLARVDATRRDDALVSTNTSGLPVGRLAEGRSDSFQRHFLATHFFNPPRYMRLVEIVPTPETAPGIVETARAFCHARLGKGVAICRDTPNFIGNRLAAIDGALVLAFALEHGMTVEEVDAATGPLIGRPRTGTFRLLDLVGVDVAAFVNRNLYALIPHDESRELLAHPRIRTLFDGMLGRGLLGDKVGQGFYKRTGKGAAATTLSLDLETFEYRPRKDPQVPSLAAGARIPDVGERLTFMMRQQDPAGALVRELRKGWAYAARRVPEISDDYPTVDRAIRWGFGHELGPFEAWDSQGVRATADELVAEGVSLPPWIGDMLAVGCERFYERNGDTTRFYDLHHRTLVAEPPDGRVRLDRLRRRGRAVASRPGASLVDLGDDVLCLEVHSKLNTLDEDVIAMMHEAASALEGRWSGLVIGNDGQDFGVGANLAFLLRAIEARDLGAVERALHSMQAAVQALRLSARPVVAAPFGRTLGGSCEIVLACDRVIALAETYMGLAEAGVGLLPAGGGCKELVRRRVSPVMEVAGADPLPALKDILQTLGLAKVSTSGDDARRYGFLQSGDAVVANRDDLLADARREVLELGAHYIPPTGRASCYAAGRQMRATLQAALYLMEQGGFASAHDRLVAGRIAHVICGGDLTSPQWVDESFLLDLEAEAFLSLCGEPKTVERIAHVLKTGKPLRN